MAGGNYWMAMLNLYISPTMVIWPRVVLICGLSMIFAPISVAAFKYTPPHFRAAAVGLFALLRNEGGSVGTSLAQTVVQRRQQFHNARVGEFLDPSNPTVQTFAEQTQAAFLQQTGDPAGSQQMALQTLENLREQQSVSLAYFDTFWLMAMLCAGARPTRPLDETLRRRKGRRHRRRLSRRSNPGAAVLLRPARSHANLSPGASPEPIIPVMRTVRSMPIVIVMSKVADSRCVRGCRSMTRQAPDSLDAPTKPRGATQTPLALAMLAVSSLAFAGCITTGPHQWLQNGLKVGPEYGTPPAPVATDWIQAGDPRVQPTRLPDGNWWNLFNDPTLTALFNLAYEQNPNIRAVGARVLEARAGQAISVGNLLAAVAASNRQLQPRQPELEHAGDQPARQVASAGFNLSFSNWFYGFNLSWELDLWGRLRRNVESSNASLDASVEDYDAALVTLFADVASSYVQYRVAQQRIKIAQDNVRIQEGVLSLASGEIPRRHHDQAGRRASADRTRADPLDDPRACRSFSARPTTRCAPWWAFRRGTSRPIWGLVPRWEVHQFRTLPDWVAAGIPADLLRRRPDVRSAERQVAAQSAQIGVAEADLYPTIFINGTIGWDAENFSQAFSNKSVLGLLTPGFRWNILNYGRIVNNVRLQEVAAPGNDRDLPGQGVVGRSRGPGAPARVPEVS